MSESNLGSSDDEATARLEVVDGFVVQIFSRNHSFDHLMWRIMIKTQDFLKQHIRAQ